MKKTLSIAIIATSVLGLGSLSSCHDEDFGVSTAVIQDHAFEQSFIKEFGKPSENQSWDFYAQKMESIRKNASLTRAAMAEGDENPVEIIKNQPYPTSQYIADIVQTIGYALEESIDNSQAGQNNYELTSTGDFKIYAVRYAGAIETQSTYRLDFGVAYYDENGNRVLNNIFETKVMSGFGNPQLAAEVKIPEGMKFHFYLKYSYPFAAGYMNGSYYSAHRAEQIFYSDQMPSFIQRNGVALDYPNYDGPSTLLYSTDHIDPETGKDEQVMMIGFEDAWGHGTGNGTQSNWFDYDFNDVVFLIEGELPVPTSKRFFCEDKTSFDWDYNDVVFDVSNTGVTLRAIGGTLPVFLRVTDRLGHSTTYGELHELMRNIQPQVDKRTYELTYERESDGEIFYKPINVALWEITGREVIWFDAVQIARWTRLGNEGENYTRLAEGEVEKFGNRMYDPTDPFKGTVELIVLPKYQSSYNLEEISNYTALTNLESDANDKIPYKIITATPPGGIPAIWTGPVSINWMKELQKINLGYQYFYGGSGDVDEEGKPIPWYENGLNSSYWYQYDGDHQ